MTETLLAGLTLAICVVLFVRLLMGWRYRQRFDLAVRRSVQACKRSVLSLYHWRSARREAERVAEEAIRRARDGRWEGNVYKPKSFRRPRKPH